MLTYAIITPNTEEPVGYLQADSLPSTEHLFDHMARACQFPSVEHFIQANPGVALGAAILH